jgi:autotransporter-associated beta strand protein
LGFLVVVGVGLLAALPAHSQTIFTWTNNSTQNSFLWDTSTYNWNTGAGTWLNDSSPTGSVALFTSVPSTVGTINLSPSVGIQANGLIFNAGAADTLSSGSLTLGLGGIQASENVTINSPITFAAPQVWNVGANNTLTVGCLGDAGSGYGLTKTGPGTLLLQGSANNYGGSTTISGGTLRLLMQPSTLGIGTFTSDATSGINSANTYTEALAFNHSSNVVINGVTFSVANNVGGTGQNGSSWSFTNGPPNPYGPNGGPNFPTGFALSGSDATSTLLGGSFYYYGGVNSLATLTVSGLTPGATYDARLYYRSWQDAPNARAADFTFNNGVTSQALVVNEDADANAHYIDYQYTVGSSGQMSISETNDPTLMQGGGSWHWYGFSNQYVAPPASGLPSTTVLAVAAGATFDANGAQQTVSGLAGVSGGYGSITLGLGALTVNATSSSTFGGVISGAGSLTKSGPATLILSGSNTYTGGTTISAGTLQLGNGSSNGYVQNNIAVNNSSTLAFANPAPQTFAGIINGTGGLAMSGPGALTLTNTANAYGGGTTVQGGTLVLGSTGGTPAGSGAINVQGGALGLGAGSQATVAGGVNINSGGTFGGGGQLAGNVAIATGGILQPTLSGAGTSTLTVNGNLTINDNATLNYNFAGPNVCDLVQVTGSNTLSLPGSTETLNLRGTLALGTYTLLSAVSGATLSDSVTPAAGWNVSGGPINDNVFYYTVTDSGSGNAVILTIGANGDTVTFSGAAGGAWDASTINWKKSTHNVAYMDTDVVTFSNTQGTSGGNITIQNGGVEPASVTFSNTSGNPYTLSGGPIWGPTGLKISSGGSVTLNSPNTYTGATVVNSGTLVLGPTGSIASSLITVSAAGNLTVNGGGSYGLTGSPQLTDAGTVQFNASQTLGSLGGGGVLGLGSGARLSLATLGGFSGSITGSGGLNYTLAGGTVAVSSAATLTYTGGTTIGGGTLQVSSDGSFGGAAGGIQINNATVEVVNTTTYPSTNRAIAIGDPNATLQVDSGTFTINSGITPVPLSNAALTLTGSGNLTFGPGATLASGANFYANSGGTINLGGATHSPGLFSVGPAGGTIANGTLIGTGYVLNGPTTVTAALQGAGATLVANANAGSSTINNAATSYGGGTTIYSGAQLNFAAGSNPGGGIVLAGGNISLNLGDPPGTSALGQGLSLETYSMPGGAGSNETGYFGSYSSLLYRLGTLVPKQSALTAANGNAALDFGGPPVNPNDNQVSMFSVLGLGASGWNTDNNNFDAFMTGRIYLSNAGTYQFRTISDDGSMLFIGGQTVVSNNAYQGFTARTGSFTVTSPGYYPIEIGYYQGGGGNGLEVQWDQGSNNWVDIPNTILMPSSVGASATYGNPVTVTANSSSTIDTQGGGAIFGMATFGGLTLNTGSTLTTTGAGVVVFQGATALSLSGGVGSYGLNVNSPEAVLLGQLNDNFAAGTIAVSGSGILTVAGPGGSVTPGTNFQVSGNLLACSPAALQGAPINLRNGGTLILASTASAATYSNAVTLTGASSTILAGNGLLGAVPASGAAQLGGVITGATATLDNGSVAIAAAQTLTLGSNGGYTLSLGPSFSLANSGMVAVTAGTVLLNAPGQVTGGTLSLTGGSAISTVQGAFAGPVLQFNGGTIGANTANTLSNTLTWGSNPSINIGGGATINFTQPLSLASGNYTVTDYSGLATFSGQLSGNGGLVTGGYPTLAHANTYQGGTWLNNDSAQITNNQAFGTGPITFNGGGFQSTVPLTGSALAITNAWSSSGDWNDVTLNGNNNVELTQGTNITNGTWLVFNITGGGALKVDGAITENNPNVPVLKNGGGMVSLASSASTYSGGTQLPGGSGTIDVAGASSQPAGATGSAVTSGPLGTGPIGIEWSNRDNNGNGTGDNTQSIGNVTGTVPATIGNTLNIWGGCLYQGSSNTLTAGVTFSGPINFVNIPGWNGYNPALVFTRGNVTFSGNLTDNGYPLYLGGGDNWNSGGVFTLSGNNTLTAGQVVISHGTLVVGSAGALDATNLPQIVLNDNQSYTWVNNWGYTPNSDASTALLIGGPYTVANSIHVTANGNGTSYLGGNTTNSSTFSGPIQLDRSATLVAASGGTATFAGPIGGGGGVTVGAAPGTVANYNGTVVMSASNSYSGDTTVAYGNLVVNGTGVINSANNVNVNAGAVLTVTGNGTINTGNVAIGPGSTLTVGGNGMVNNATIAVNAGGVLTLGGNGALTNGAVTVNSGGLFNGSSTGPTTSTVTISGGGVLSPAYSSPLNLGVLNMNDGSILNLTASGSTLSALNVAGLNTTGNQTLQITAMDTQKLQGGSYTFLSYPSGNGPNAGPQSNWIINSSATATWLGTGSGVWDAYPQPLWGGVEVDGGTVMATGTALQLVGATALAYSTAGPTAAANVFIQQPLGATVTGPASPTPIASLTLGSATGGANTLTLGAGALSVSGAVTVNPTGVLNVGTSSITAGALSVAGSLGVASGGSLWVYGGAATVTGTANFGAASGGHLDSLTLTSGSTALGNQSISTLTVNAAQAAAPTAGLLRHYTFDNAANLLADSSPNNVAGVAANGTISYSPGGVFGGCADFSSGAYLIPGANASAAVLPTTGWTFTTWFMGNETGAYRTLLHGGQSYGGNNAYEVLSPNNSNNQLGLFNNGGWTGGGGDQQAGTATSPTDAGTWHFLAAVYNGAGTTSYYLGSSGQTAPVLVGQVTGEPMAYNQVIGAINNDDSNLGLGRQWAQYLDDVYLYGTGLNTSQLAGIMTGVTYPAPVLTFSPGSTAQIATFNYASGNPVVVPANGRRRHRNRQRLRRVGGLLQHQQHAQPGRQRR